MDPEGHANLREEISSKAQVIVNEVMPEKIITLDRFYKSILTDHATVPQFRDAVEEQLKNISSECFAALKAQSFAAANANVDGVKPGKKRKIGESESTDGEAAQIAAATPLIPAPSNAKIVEVMNLLKDELLEEIEMLNTVKIWIQLNIPRIEDGNNFGVGIQEEMVNELARAENDAIAFLDSMTKYFISRGRLIHKLMKYPQIEDYRRAVTEIDEKEYINMRMCALDLRNTYAILYDLIHKNKDKIERPRTSHHQSLY